MILREEVSVLRSLALLGALTYLAAAANAQVREVTSEAAHSGISPRFFKGYIYWADREPLRIYTPDGHQAPVMAPSKGTAQAIAVDTDGTLAVSWTTGSSGGIDLHEPSGALVRTIQTGPYWPTYLSFAEDHSLWSVGWQLVGHPFKPDRDDYMIVRKFLPNGQQAGAYLPRSIFPEGLEPGAEPWRLTNCISVSHDRVGLLVISGMDSNKTEWVELDLNGALTGRWRLDQFTNDLRVAFTSDDHIFVYYRDLDGRNPHLSTLDRETSTRKQVAIPGVPNGYMASADGDQLIFSDYSAGPIHVRWYQHP
jgi:hypothetical protein